MNRSAQCIKMLQILNARKRVSVAELADLLETKKRNIIELKKELEASGYVINFYTGKYGGYELDKTANIPAIKFTESEKIALTEAYDFISKKSDYLHKEDFENAYIKIMSETGKTNKNFISVYNRFPMNFPRKRMEELYNDISFAINNKLKLKIKYTSKRNIDNIHIIHPYKIYLSGDSWFVLANKEGLEKVLYYKINRIKELEILYSEKPFRIPYSYKESDYLDDFGMKCNGKWIRVKCLMFNNANMMLNERIYGKDQEIEHISKDCSIMTATMQDIELLSFFLGWGTNCKILEPVELRERIKDEIAKMNKIYN